jgi:DNA polymerase
MLRLARPQTAKKRKKPADPAQQERDLALLLERCKRDVEATRAVHRSQQLRQQLPQERELLLLDARINARGVHANTPFLEAVRKLAIEERNNVNVRLDELTKGIVTSVDQVARIKKLVNERGHELTTLGKRSVAAALAHKPDAYVTELLRLRQQGAYASVRMAKRLLGYADPDDGRIRDALRIYGAGPGRWSSPGPQLQNLRRNDSQYPVALVEALAVAAELSRAALCAHPGHVLRCADFGAIESRLLAWYAGETWKLDAYRQFDATGDKTIEPYRVIAARMLNKDVRAIEPADRQQGKAAELACGFGGSVGAWRRIAGNDGRSDAEVLAIVKQWRFAHPAIVKFWRELATAMRVAIRTGRPISVGTRPQVITAFDGQALTLTLPSGRAINYPGARLIPNAKFEDAAPDIEFFDNARGGWRRTRGWYGTFVENLIQGTARDLLVAALLRFDARGFSIVFHCHDEVVIETPENAISDADTLAILLEPPAWAAGLPLNGKVHAGPLYLAEPETPRQPLEPEQSPRGDRRAPGLARRRGESFGARDTERQREARFRPVVVEHGPTAARLDRGTLSRRNPRHQRWHIATRDPRTAAVSSTLRLRRRRTAPLYHRADARSADRYAGRDSPDRARAVGEAARRGHQARPPGARADGRSQTVAAERRRSTRGRRGHRDGACRSNPDVVSGRATRAGMVGHQQARARSAAGDLQRPAPDSTHRS